QQQKTSQSAAANPDLINQYAADPKKFMTTSLPQLTLQHPAFGPAFLKSLAVANNDQHNKYVATSLAQNPKLWQQIKNAPGISDPKVQQLIQMDPHFKWLNTPKTESAVGVATDAVFDPKKKSRDWNWSGSPGSTGVT